MSFLCDKGKTRFGSPDLIRSLTLTHIHYIEGEIQWYLKEKKRLSIQHSIDESHRLTRVITSSPSLSFRLKTPGIPTLNRSVFSQNSHYSLLNHLLHFTQHFVCIILKYSFFLIAHGFCHDVYQRKMEKIDWKWMTVGRGSPRLTHRHIDQFRALLRATLS